MAMATSAKLRRREAPPHGCTAAGFHQVLQGLQQDRQHSGLPGRQQHLRQDLVEGADCLHALHDPGCWALLTCSIQGVHAEKGRTCGPSALPFCMTCCVTRARHGSSSGTSTRWKVACRAVDSSCGSCCSALQESTTALLPLVQQPQDAFAR